MEAFLAILAILLCVATPIIGIAFLLKRKTSYPKRIIGGPLGPRQRDGALTYNQYRGMRVHAEIEDPREHNSPRQRRRHASSSQQHKPTKPWMK